MSDTRVETGKDLEGSKRRSGSGNFGSFLSSEGGQANQRGYRMIADFLSEAFEDKKLDDNELAGMKVIAGMATRDQSPTAHLNCRGFDQNSRSEQAEDTKECRNSSHGENSCGAEIDGQSGDFTSMVSNELSKSKNQGPGERLAAEAANRLTKASREQQITFFEKLKEMMKSDGDIDETNHAEGSKLTAFVDGLLSQKSQAPSDMSHKSFGERQNHDLIRDFLSEAMSNNRLSHGELAALVALIDKESSKKYESGESPTANSQPLSISKADPSTTEAARSGRNLDRLVSSGAISYETSEGAKAILAKARA